MSNEQIRTAMHRSGVRQWQVAERLGISEFTYSRWLRSELPDDKKVQILQAISDVKSQKNR